MSFGHSGRRRCIIGISDLDPDARGHYGWRKTPAQAQRGCGNPLLSRRALTMARSALFDLAIDNKLRGCDTVKMKIGDIAAGGVIRNRATVIQQKTKRPVQFELDL
jgi:hypothetical protein